MSWLKQSMTGWQRRSKNVATTTILRVLNEQGERKGRSTEPG